MHLKICALFVLYVSSVVNGFYSKRTEENCIEYYKNDINFDLTLLNGDFYAVYYWPPIQRTRERCEVISFRKLSYDETLQTRNECYALDLAAEPTVMRSTYKNSGGKLVHLLYYGSDEVKNMYRACDKNISKYIFSKINDNYILGINCSSGGRGILLSRFLPNRSAVEGIVNGIEIMTGRQGSPDCVLRP